MLTHKTIFFFFLSFWHFLFLSFSKLLCNSSKDEALMKKFVAIVLIERHRWNFSVVVVQSNHQPCTKMANIVLTIIHYWGNGHNNHDNKYPSSNSKGTPWQHPWDPFYLNFFYKSSLGCIHVGENHRPYFIVFHLTSHVVWLKKLKFPWVLWEG